jgi:hypothetical protein
VGNSGSIFPQIALIMPKQEKPTLLLDEREQCINSSRQEKRSIIDVISIQLRPDPM